MVTLGGPPDLRERPGAHSDDFRESVYTKIRRTTQSDYAQLKLILKLILNL